MKTLSMSTSLRDVARGMTDYRNPRSMGARFRMRRLGHLLTLIRRTFDEHGHVSVVDVGGTHTYWGLVPANCLEDCNVHVTVVNLPNCELPPDGQRFSFVHGDGCDLRMFRDRSFHIAHSNSVIEHVGDWDHMVRFAAEIRRIAPRYVIQTPNHNFPIEPHCTTPFFHWLPRPVRMRIVMRFALGQWERATSVDDAVRKVDSSSLLSRSMFRELFKDAEIITERFMLLPKSFIAVKQ